MNRKKDNLKVETPRIVQSHDIHLDKEYVKWIAELKDRYRSAQTKAAVKVNAEKLMLSGYRKRMLLCHNGLHLLHRKNNINVYNSKADRNEKMNSCSPFV